MSRQPGKVYLIGAGPGDSIFLTERCRDLLRHCDVVVYDETVEDFFLGFLGRRTRVIFVGSTSDRPAYLPEQVNRMLVDEARRHHQVVRLRGGDPFLLGQGSEEALYCHAQGVDFEVVPGVSLLGAACAFAGIPLIQRGLSDSVFFVHGPYNFAPPVDADEAQEAKSVAEEPWSSPRRAGIKIRRRRKSDDEPDKGLKALQVRNEVRLALGRSGLWVRRDAEEQVASSVAGNAGLEPARIDWQAIGRAADTLVFLAPEGAFEVIRKGLLYAGRAAREPVAILSGAATGDQISIISTIANMARDSLAAALRAPVFLIVGDVVNLRDHLNIHEQKSLFGLSVGFVYTAMPPRSVFQSLEESGARTERFALREPGELAGLKDEFSFVKDDIRSADVVVFTSSVSVRIFLGLLANQEYDLRLLPEKARIVAFGEETGRLLDEVGLVHEVIEDVYTPVSLVQRIGKTIRDKRVVLVGEAGCLDEGAAQLKKTSKCELTCLPVYERRLSPRGFSSLTEALKAGRLDTLMFLSPDAVQCMIEKSRKSLIYKYLNKLVLYAATGETVSALATLGLSARLEDAENLLTALHTLNGNQPAGREGFGETRRLGKLAGESEW